MSQEETKHEIIDTWLDNLTIDKAKSLARTLLVNLGDLDAAEIASDFVHCPEFPEQLTSHEVAEHVSFENVHTVAYFLVQEHVELARTMYQELQWWKEQGVLYDKDSHSM